MPMYDLRCENDHKQMNRLLKIGERPPCPECGAPMETLWTSAPGVIGDECDIYVKHAICHEDGTPRRFTSKSEMARAAKAAGYENHVVHQGRMGSDKSPFTSRWV